MSFEQRLDRTPAGFRPEQGQGGGAAQLRLPQAGGRSIGRTADGRRDPSGLVGPIIRTEGLTKVYAGSEFTAVDRLDLEVGADLQPGRVQHVADALQERGHEPRVGLVEVLEVDVDAGEAVRREPVAQRHGEPALALDLFMAPLGDAALSHAAVGMGKLYLRRNATSRPKYRLAKTRQIHLLWPLLRFSQCGK